MAALDPTERCPAEDADGDRCARVAGHDGDHWCDDPCGVLVVAPPQQRGAGRPPSEALLYDCPVCPSKAGTPCREKGRRYHHARLVLAGQTPPKGGKRSKDKATARKIERLTAAFVKADTAAQYARAALLSALEAVQPCGDCPIGGREGNGPKCLRAPLCDYECAAMGDL